MHRRITKTLNMIGLVQLKGLEYFRQQKEDGFYCLLQMESWLVIQLAGLKTPDVYQQTYSTLVQVSELYRLGRYGRPLL